MGRGGKAVGRVGVWERGVWGFGCAGDLFHLKPQASGLEPSLFEYSTANVQCPISKGSFVRVFAKKRWAEPVERGYFVQQKPGAAGRLLTYNKEQRSAAVRLPWRCAL